MFSRFFYSFNFFIFFFCIFFLFGFVASGKEIGVDDSRFNLSTEIQNISTSSSQERQKFIIPFKLTASPALAQFKNSRSNATNNDAYYDSFKIGVLYDPKKVRPVSVNFANADSSFDLTSNTNRIFRSTPDFEKIAHLSDLLALGMLKDNPSFTESDLYKQFPLVSIVGIASVEYPVSDKLKTCPKEVIDSRSDFYSISNGVKKLSCVYVEYRVQIPDIFSFPSERKPLLFSDSISPFSITFEYLDDGETRVRPYVKFPSFFVDGESIDTSPFERPWGAIEYNTFLLKSDSEIPMSRNIEKKVKAKKKKEVEKKVKAKKKKEVEKKDFYMKDYKDDDNNDQEEEDKRDSDADDGQEYEMKDIDGVDNGKNKINQILGDTLSIGSKSARVMLLQEFLNSAGFEISSSGPGSVGNETNYFGPATERALKKFQMKNNIKKLGILDLQTQKKIQSFGFFKKNISSYIHPELKTQINKEEFVSYLRNKISEITLIIQVLLKEQP